MKNKVVLIIVLCLSLISTVAVMAEDASELIGSITGYVEEIQNYPAVINEALCNGDKDEYSLKMGELSDLIQAANDAMAEAGLPNTLNLWAVYGAITANPHCGVHDAALSRADWSREELDRIGYKYGLYDTRLSVTEKSPKICIIAKGPNKKALIPVYVGWTRAQVCDKFESTGGVCDGTKYDLNDVLVSCKDEDYMANQTFGPKP